MGERFPCRLEAGYTLGSTYLHCLDEQGHEAFDLQQDFCVRDIIERRGGQVDGGSAHGLPQLFDLDSIRLVIAAHRSGYTYICTGAQMWYSTHCCFFEDREPCNAFQQTTQR